MNVLHVISGIDKINGGPTIALLGLVRAQKNAGIDAPVVPRVIPRVIAAFARPEAVSDAADFRDAGIETTLVGPVSRLIRGYHSSLHASLTKQMQTADVVHIHAVWEPIQIIAARVAKKMNKPYVLTPHGMLGDWAMSRRPMVKRMLGVLGADSLINNATRLHATTTIEQAQLLRRFPQGSVVLEPNGIDTSEFQVIPPRGFLRDRFPALKQSKILLHLGRVSEQKGLHVLLPAIASLGQDFAEWTLVIVGPDGGAYEQARRREARELGIADRVIFAGPMFGADRIAALRDADLFALASHQENFAIAVLEAMAAGLAVVVSDNVMLHPTITQARAGGVSPLSVEAVSRELARWMKDESLREEAGQRGRQLAMTQFDWNNIAIRWTKHYADIVGT